MKDQEQCGTNVRLNEWLGNTTTQVDWEQHRYGNGVLCEFRPRAEYKGRQPKPGMLDKSGAQFVLETLWLMDDGDPYPGEYALSTVVSCQELLSALGVTWIASGDVVVLPNERA